MSQQGEPMSTTTSGSSRARTPRTGNKIPKERFRITAVDAVGLPASPKKILSRFRSICGVIGRQKFNILQDDIKLVPAAEKDIAWLTFKESFDYPAEHEDRLRWAAFKVMGNAWKNFKTKLVGEFVYNPANLDPREKFPWITEQVWEEFHTKKSTPESRSSSEAYRLLQTKNQHPHRLGTAGYAGKEEEWQREDEEAEESNTPLVFGDIPHPRARNWARARYQKKDDGTIFMPNPEDQRVYEAIKELVAEQQASQEACSQRYEDDLLTKVLGNKEHRGRTRGVGSSIPWKYGFPDYAWQYKKWTSNKAEKDARLEAKIRALIRAELTSEFDEKLESMRAKIRQEIREEQQNPQAAAAGAHEELGSPTQKRSSCTSTEVAENPTSVDSAIDHITEPTSCTLTVRVMPTFTVPAAEGLAYKPTPETRVHGAQLRSDCAKVQVDSVKLEYELFPLKYPPNDEVLSLGNARGTFIQWPKDLIEIRITLQYDTDFWEDRTEADSKAIHEPPPMKKSRKAHSSPQRITLDKPEAKGRGRGGKVQSSLLAPRKLDLGKGQEEAKGKEVKKKYVAPQEFQLGMPLVGDDVLAAMGTACKDLHAYYMEKSNARKPNKATNILGEHDGKPFLGPTNYIVVDFKDLFDLYRLRAVDTSLLKCYSFTHWILLVITPKWSTCHYLNSRIDKNAYDWTPIQLAIDEAWVQYVQRGGLRKTGHDTLIHKKDFPVKQQIGDQCGFHVCHNMRLLYREKVKTLAEFEGTITKSLPTSFEEAMINTYYATVMM
uniref:Transposon protein, putative, CACTA, En/Spm sub-class n=1 Tax=Oryza sativa subsp. japonica TaxID=39947 RepID=Q338L1_ORYSJ|nr:transposon protein, putative, CACTA, En/Spm sub-class [Oryza sativa Japonica Group]